MDFYLILQEIMDEKAVNVATTARMCNLSDGTVRSILSRKQKNVALEVAFKLSSGLGVSLERLNGMPEKEIPSSNAAVQRLISLFHQLNEEGQERLLESVDDMVASGKYIKSNSAELGKKEA